MIIDFHTHIFPDKIAEKTIPYLMKMGKVDSFGNGTLTCQQAAMKSAGIDYAVVMPVCTKPSQFDSINRFAAEINGKGGIISFGGIHPLCDGIDEKLKSLKEHGFKGIKLHPDYQETHILDENMVKLIKKALELDFYITLHAGIDPAFPEFVHCPPADSKKLLDLIYGTDRSSVTPRLILAHLGGYNQFDQVEKHLIGEPVYFDLAVILDKAPKEQLERIIKSHGADKILFASDFPWSDLTEDLKIFNSLDLTDEEKELILHKNAEKMLF